MNRNHKSYPVLGDSWFMSLISLPRGGLYAAKCFMPQGSRFRKAISKIRQKYFSATFWMVSALLFAIPFFDYTFWRESVL